ncbi:hypothetical protein NDU88_003416 [Pleurodeles waltl]|uniref:Uncharacterized protein n=1 Tax=Pleurodeles waltl TaxID=8319 RepID=A0AAV7UCF0_PLEWA|nr:hypothetical protein NDU88_003416 [Pleurodeles waltl]
MCSERPVARTIGVVEMSMTNHAPIPSARKQRRSEPCVHGTVEPVAAAPLLCVAEKIQPLRIRRNSSNILPIYVKIIGKTPNTLRKSEWMARGITPKIVWKMDTNPDPTALKKCTIPTVLEALKILESNSLKCSGKLVFNRDCISADDLTICRAYVSMADVNATCF